SERWQPISPVSGRLDAFEWKDPLAGEDHGTVIEHRAEPQVPATIERAPAAGDASAGARAEVAARSALGEAGLPPAEASLPPADDPGPNGEAEPEVEPPPPSDGWRRLRALFR